MKRILAIILSCAMLLSVSACSSEKADNTETTVQSTTTEPTQAVTVDPLSDEVKEQIDTALEKNNFEGIVYLTQNGTVVYESATGKDEKGADLTVESPMYIGSVSKQFCATAIMMLKEQGKLTVDDTLDKFFPEYEIGKDITIKNLLSMRSGIPEMLGNLDGVSVDKTESENVAIIKKWIFEQPLDFEPDSENVYSNTNYFLLGIIVEEVSGQPYNEFIRENIFKPLGMKDSGFVNEVKTNPDFSKGLTYDTFPAGTGAEDGVSKGAGDIVTTAPDMDKWMTGLRSGKIISDESYREMIADHSPDIGAHYGYGLQAMYKKGIGHGGKIGNYMCLDYINEEYGYNLFAITSTTHDKVQSIPNLLMDILIK